MATTGTKAKAAKKAPISALESKREALGKENPEAVKFLHWPLPNGVPLHESSSRDRGHAASTYRERVRILHAFAEILANAGTDCEAAAAMAGIVSTWPEAIAGRRLSGAPAPIFDLELPSGVRLGQASESELEAAVMEYAERGDVRARTMRKLVGMARQFNLNGY